jgi:putative transposase
MPRGTYRVPRVHAQRWLGRGVRCGDKSTARLMRSLPPPREAPQFAPAVRDDPIRRRCVAAAPNRLWLTDISDHPTRECKVYCAAALDVYSRRKVGWSIADHLRARSFLDAIEMARWCRRPPAGQTIVRSDRASQYTA